MEALGIEYTMLTKDRVVGRMKVCQRTCQPFGILHGGASFALAETLAGIGSVLNLPEDKLPVGQSGSVNHLSYALDGETVEATATPIHIGQHTHVWNIDVRSGERLISSVRFTNQIVKQPNIPSQKPKTE